MCSVPPPVAWFGTSSVKHISLSTKVLLLPPPGANVQESRNHRLRRKRFEDEACLLVRRYQYSDLHTGTWWKCMNKHLSPQWRGHLSTTTSQGRSWKRSFQERKRGIWTPPSSSWFLGQKYPQRNSIQWRVLRPWSGRTLVQRKHLQFWSQRKLLCWFLFMKTIHTINLRSTWSSIFDHENTPRLLTLSHHSLSFSSPSDGAAGF